MKFTFATALLMAGILADPLRETKRFTTPVRSVDKFK